MEWSEFTQYIIDAVIGEKDARFFDGNLKVKLLFSHIIFKKQTQFICNSLNKKKFDMMGNQKNSKDF